MKNYDNDLRRIWRNRYKILIILVGFIVISIFMIAKFIEETNKEHQERISNRTFIEFPDSISGYASYSSCFKGAARLTLKDSSLYILPYMQNYNYEPSLLCDFIRDGDSIYKKANRDTLFIYRYESAYYFLFSRNVRKR